MTFKMLTRFAAAALILLLASSAVAAQTAERDVRIHLKAMTFDPLEAMPEISPELRLTSREAEEAKQIVQLTRPPTREEFELLRERFGLQLTRYIPSQAYLEDVSPETMAELEELDLVRWIGPYLPAYKLDPAMGRRLDQEEHAGEPFELNVQLFLDADLESVERRAEEAGFQVLNAWDVPEQGVKRLKLSAPTLDRVEELARMPEVRWIEEFGHFTLRNGTTSWVVQTNVNNSRTVYAEGLHGEGQTIGHLDSALDIRHCFFADSALDAGGPSPGPAHRKVVAYRNSGGIPSSAGSDLHGTHTAGILAGQDNTNLTNVNNGQAFAARISHGLLNDVTGSDTNASNLLSMLADQHGDGARIFSNSWGDDGTTTYTTWSEDIDRFMWQNEDDLVIFAVTNTATLKTPENAKNVLAVGATQQTPNQNQVGSGGLGPTADNRRKPEIFAPGCSLTASRAGTACTFWNAPSPPFVSVCGTSWAAPVVAGAAAIVRQYFTEGWYPSGTRQAHHAFIPSGALVKATLLNATVDMTATPGAGAANRYPSNAEGWGRLLLENGLFFEGDPRNTVVWDARRAAGLFTGDPVRTHNFNVAAAGQPLKVTLVWTEPPATAAAAQPWVVNDLDLTVTDPNGVVFRGNDFNAANGTTIPNGGTSDSLNNVEQVVVNNPTPGQWTLSVVPTAVNTGPQGYALVATADTPEPPVPTGDQDTLVVRVGISDVLGGATPSLPTVQNLITDLAAYIDEVSQSEATVDPLYADPITLDHARSFYFHPSRNPLIEMTEETIAKLLAADGDVFDRGTVDPADDVDRMILVLNDMSFTGDWATTGPWPYDLPGGLTRPISVSIQSVFNDPAARFAHGMGHQLGMVDLHAHPGVVFAQPHVDEWDNMASPFTRSGVLAWSRERAGWLTAHGTPPAFVPRPAAGGSVNQTFGIDFLSNDNADPKAVAIGLTEGAATLEEEEVFYWVEARSNAAGTVDQVLPETGVLAYFVDETVPQGDGPVRILDDDLTTAHLADAALGNGDSKSPAGRGLTLTAQAGTGGSDRNVVISYDPPETDNDVRIRVGDPHWTSPDIWVDSQRDGFDQDEGRVPMDRGDQAVEGEVNRLYVRLSNPGPGDAFDFTIFVRVSEPYHTVGGQADFNRFVGQLHVPLLEDGEEYEGYVEWIPDEDGNPHSCVEVTIPNVFNDMNPNNNRAQQNLQEVTSSTGSPYDVVTYHFGLTNEEDTQQLYYFRAQGAPDDWSEALAPRSVLLAPGERIEATLTVQPPEDAPVCTEHRIDVTSWRPSGDTLVPVGGGTVQVDLRNRTRLGLETGVRRCEGKATYDEFRVAARPQAERPCRELVAQGCTAPPRPNQEIVVRYEHPSGYPIYRRVTTDAAGCFSDFLVVTEGGPWQVTAEYPGDDCSGPAVTPPSDVGIGLPVTGDRDGDGRPDDEEPQGDHDGDGLIGIDDPDSDGDGVRDGDELQGDCDRDGLANVVDPDSDGDGVPDGRDATPCGGERLQPRGLRYSLHVGSAHPLEDLDRVADANVYAAVDAGYRLTDRLDLQAILGLAQLTAESSTGIDHPRWIHASLNVQALFGTPTGLRPYLRAGVGAYEPKSGSTEAGFNLGAGARVPIQAPFDLELGADLHQIDTEQETRFVTVQIGVLFR